MVARLDWKLPGGPVDRDTFVLEYQACVIDGANIQHTSRLQLLISGNRSELGAEHGQQFRRSLERLAVNVEQLHIELGNVYLGQEQRDRTPQSYSDARK